MTAPRSRVRYIDYRPDEFLTGTATMTNEMCGAYWRLCSLMLSTGRPVPFDVPELCHRLKTKPARLKHLVGELIRLGKLDALEDGSLINAAAQAALDAAARRIETRQENGRLGGRPRRDATNRPAISTESKEEHPKALPDHNPTTGTTRTRVLPPISEGTTAKNNGLENRDVPNYQRINESGRQEPANQPENEGWRGKVIALSPEEVRSWKRDFPHLALFAELAERDNYLASPRGAGSRPDWKRSTLKQFRDLEQKAHERVVAAQKAAAPAPAAPVGPHAVEIGRLSREHQRTLDVWMRNGCNGIMPPKPPRLVELESGPPPVVHSSAASVGSNVIAIAG